ncbi:MULTISPECIES: hypothetical protein [Paraburkholderia]|uniref:Uncharacterized protein n=1 Tax=Paraburkholderia acidicola TaxID=1912599 RepID=A0ABV1M050_9BURK
MNRLSVSPPIKYEARLSERMISFANTAIVTLPARAPDIAVIPEKTEGTMLHDEAAASALVDQLVTYAEVSVTPTQHNAAVEILRSLPDDDSSVARFVDHCASDDSLTELADALRKRLDGPWKLL